MPTSKQAQRAAAIRRYYAQKKGYMRGSGAYQYGTGGYKAGRSYLTGRGSYQVKTKASKGWSAPKIGAGVGRVMGAIAAPIASRYVGPAISEALPSLAESAGRGMGRLFKSITGWGDYTVNENSIMYPDNIVPSFGEDSIRIKKREYITDIDATTSFTNLSIPIQPGLDTSFPWLSSIAQNYEQYHVNGLVYQFVSTSSDAIASTTDLGLGLVILATEYDSTDKPFVNSPQMMGSMFSNSCKPSENCMHAIECAPNQQAQRLYYIRTGDVPQGADARLYDLGLFQIATDKMPANYTGAGQLWVSYDITFTKSVMNNQLGFSLNTDQYYLTTMGTSAHFGTAQAQREGSNLGTYFSTNSTLNFPAKLSTGYFLIIWRTNGTSGATVPPTWTFNSCTSSTVFMNDTSNVITSGNVTTSNMIQAFVVKLTDFGANIALSGGTFPGGTCNGDLIISQCNGELYV